MYCKKGACPAPQPSNKEDAGVIYEGWVKNFVVPNEDDIGPMNIPGHNPKESMSIDFLSLIFGDNFWQNLTEKTNLCTHQMNAEMPNYYYSKNLKDDSVDEMKAFIGLRIYMSTGM